MVWFYSIWGRSEPLTLNQVLMFLTVPMLCLLGHIKISAVEMLLSIFFFLTGDTDCIAPQWQPGHPNNGNLPFQLFLLFTSSARALIS